MQNKEQEINLFEVDPDSGSVIYKVVTTPDPEQDLDDSGVNINDGISLTPTPSVGDIVLDKENDVQVTPISTETPSDLAVLDGGSVGPYVVLSENVAAALLGETAASGSIGSSTLDFFDRVASGLPSHYAYIAYRIDADDSYDAVLYYGHLSENTGDSITFSDGKKITVLRESSGYSTTQIDYISEDISDVSVSFSLDSSVLYYTNAVPGYPLLGGYNAPDLSFYLIPALVGALACVIFSKLVFRR